MGTNVFMLAGPALKVSQLLAKMSCKWCDATQKTRDPMMIIFYKTVIIILNASSFSLTAGWLHESKKAWPLMTD